MTETGPSQRRAAMAQTELFAAQLAELTDEARRTVWRSLSRARDGLPTPGVAKPWAGDWLRWPCGDQWVLMRPLTPDEVAHLTGTPGEGFLLVRIDPKPA